MRTRRVDLAPADGEHGTEQIALESLNAFFHRLAAAFECVLFRFHRLDLSTQTFDVARDVLRLVVELRLDAGQRVKPRHAQSLFERVEVGNFLIVPGRIVVDILKIIKQFGKLIR